MKKVIILTLAAVVLLVWWYFLLDAYLCSHLYYGRWPFLSCAGWQGKGINMVWNNLNWYIFIRGLLSAAPLALYMIYAKKINLQRSLSYFFLWLVLYILWYLAFRDAFFAQGVLILIFNLALLTAIIVCFLIAMIILWSMVFHKLKRRMWYNIHDIFLKFTLGLIVFCICNVILLQLHLFYGIVIYLEVAALCYLVYQQRWEINKISESVEDFLSTLREQFQKHKITYILYIVLVILSVMYIYIWFNLAYIPYPTAWDANHAYILFPRIWSINNGLYWSSQSVSALPNLWYWFLTFWFKFASAFPIGKWLFGISPDALTVIMNYWSGPFVLMSTWFLLHALLNFIDKQKKHAVSSEKFILPMVAFGLILMILWLTSGMGAFLVFVDNKPDLAVMFFAILALYTWIKFATRLTSDEDNQYTKHYAILSGFFFAASILAKPTWMFDIVHFAILFLLQWNSILFAVGSYVFILGALGASKMLLVQWFLTKTQSYYLLISGLVLIIIGIIPTFRKWHYRVYLRHFLMWIATIIITVVVYKWPFALIKQVQSGSFSVPWFVRTLILGYEKNTSSQKVLLASTVSVDTLENADAQDAASGENVQPVIAVAAPAAVSKDQCIAAKPQNTSDLYKNLKEMPTDWLSEDQGRYIWFWQKVFKNTMFFSLLPQGCFSIYDDVRGLCSSVAALKTADKDALLKTLKEHNISEKVSARIQTLEQNTESLEIPKIRNQIVQYIESNSLLVTNQVVAIPYKFLIPFNVTVNWSLQNLSSYYTDIGIIWLLSLMLIVIWLIYAIVNRKKQLMQISVISIGAWAIWWVVGSAIVWYSLGIILWTILWVVVFVYEIIHDKKSEKYSHLQSMLIRAIVIWMTIWCFTQFILNIIRISSQWTGWPFAWYKMNVWQDMIITPQLTQENVVKFWYSSDDVFKIQFPHYIPILEKINARGVDEWVTIAWSYMQYFINNQSNIEDDWFLSKFWQNSSDNNVCNTYLRLKDKKKKFLIIDPNIASVVMGEWNKTLFDRFFAVLSEDGKTIYQHGTLTMLQSLVQQWYLKLLSTNNLVAKYSYILPDNQLANALQVPVGPQLLIERSKMSAARFFPNPEKYANAALQVFASRISTFEAISDIADMMWKPIRYEEIKKAAQAVMSWINKSNYDGLQKTLEELSPEERLVLQQYLALRKAQQENAQQFRQFAVNLVSQSLSSPSQIITFTVE